MVVPPKHPKMIILVGKPMVVGETHHFRVHPQWTRCLTGTTVRWQCRGCPLSLATSQHLGWAFFFVRARSDTLPKTDGRPLKIDGWFRCISYWNSPLFRGHSLVFQGVDAKKTHFHVFPFWILFGKLCCWSTFWGPKHLIPAVAVYLFEAFVDFHLPWDILRTHKSILTTIGFL